MMDTEKNEKTNRRRLVCRRFTNAVLRLLGVPAYFG